MRVGWKRIGKWTRELVINGIVVARITRGVKRYNWEVYHTWNEGGYRRFRVRAYGHEPTVKLAKREVRNALDDS